uniref:Uncharacterized protein n=1 Tax=Marseillevirus LCMAC201 TaxID=2506605 RepID=A0A481YXB0_9VIRU|nr:MAG: hypothetical protein LCMAC201_05730 [Marseillevirus LCMAC201]
MTKKFIEYGRINILKDVPSFNTLTEASIKRGIISGFMIVVGIGTLCADAIWEGSIILSIVPLLWICRYTHDDVVSYERDEAFPTLKQKINILAELMAPLPVPNLCDYDPKEYQDLSEFSTRKKLLDFLNPVVKGCGFTVTATALKVIDPRIRLKIADDNTVLPTDIPIKIQDSGWIGTPTANTRIVEIDSYENEAAEFICV